jgi:osmotically-inducible protein OsmY
MLLQYANAMNRNQRKEKIMKQDTDIRNNVQNELQWDPSVESRGISVNVQEGIVTLFGNVPHFADKYSAEKIAKRVVGVRAIANDITVNIPVPGKRSDTDIAIAAANALKWNASLGQCDIKAVVSSGCITLSGDVAYGYQVNVAEAAVRYLLGVTAILNDLTIKPSVKMVDVKQKIEDAFQRQARLDAKDIDVGLNDNKVTLKGFVSSWREKDDAARAAWAAPGVCKVENQLLVSF